MNKVKTSIQVNSILFESNDSEVLIKGNVKAGQMNYDTDLIITHSQLNIILNRLQHQNKSISVNDYLTSEKMYDGETLYSAIFTGETNNKIDMSLLAVSAPLRQIRA